MGEMHLLAALLKKSGVDPLSRNSDHSFKVMQIYLPFDAWHLLQNFFMERSRRNLDR
jgi:hypothetical protein